MAPALLCVTKPPNPKQLITFPPSRHQIVTSLFLPTSFRKADRAQERLPGGSFLDFNMQV